MGDGDYYLSGCCPPHPVILTRAFWIRSTEVTQVEFTYRLGLQYDRFPLCGPTCPADRVFWEWAAYYCNLISEEEGLPTCYRCVVVDGDIGCLPSEQWLTPYDCPGYRLPTEAEWEYAARAGSPHANYALDWGGSLDEIAWYDGNSGGTTHPIGMKVPNALGLYDMLGNVYEWCADGGGHDYSEDPAIDPYFPIQGDHCLFRGGEYSSLDLPVWMPGGGGCGLTGMAAGFRPVRTANGS